MNILDRIDKLFLSINGGPRSGNQLQLQQSTI